MDHLREGIGLRGYGQRDPKQEYKKEGFSMFQAMMGRIIDNGLGKLYRVRMERQEAETPQQEAARKLRFYKEGVNDYAVAWVIQRTLGGHAIPLDEPTLRVLTRLGVIEEAEPDSLEAVRGSIEHVSPKTRGPERR